MFLEIGVTLVTYLLFGKTESSKASQTGLLSTCECKWQMMDASACFAYLHTCTYA